MSISLESARAILAHAPSVSQPARHDVPEVAATRRQAAGTLRFTWVTSFLDDGRVCLRMRWL